MITFSRVDQTTFGNPDGNCLAACFSTITSIALEELDDGIRCGEEDGSWWNGLRQVLNRHGWDVTIYHCAVEGVYPQGFSVAGGESPRAGDDEDHPGHAVVHLNGQLMHDPHPDRTGLAGPVLEYYIPLPPR